MTGEDQSRQGAANTQTEKERREDRKSKVRVRLTYAAAGFLFGVGLLLVGWFMYREDVDKALTVFSTVLPTTTFIIGYWFAKRTGESPRSGNGEGSQVEGGSSTTTDESGEGPEASAQQDEAGENQRDG